MPGGAAAPFCGPVHPMPFLGALGVNPADGSAVCDGGAAFDLSLPLNASVAGSVLSTQCATM